MQSNMSSKGDLLNELAVMTVAKRVKRKRHGNYNKRATKKQTAAQKRNFSIFRLRGMVASLNTITSNGVLDPMTNLRLYTAMGNVKDALISEAGK